MAMAGAIVPVLIPGAKAETTGSETSAAGGAVGKENAALLNAVEDTKALPDYVQREWLGPHFWGNRLQDWRLIEGRIECVSDEKGPDLRTVSLITRDLKPGEGSATITATLGRISPKGKGFGGFLVGAGAGKLDYRAAALVQKASGEGGGLLCVVDTDGKAAFREHTSEDKWQEYKELPSTKMAGTVAYSGQPLTLTLQVAPGGGEYALTLTAKDGDAVVSSAVLEGVKEEELLGGIMLVSAATSGPDGARYWFKDVTADGDKVGRSGERAVGPVLGTLFSLNGNVMKMTAQLMPISASDPQHVTLEVREAGQGTWREVARKEIAGGYCATFRLDNWDDSKDWQYRVAYEDDGTGQGRKAYYEGTVRRDPRHAGRQLRIGLYSCTIAAARNLDGGGGRRQLPNSQDLGRYTPQCIYMPYTEIVEGSKKLNPDMLAFVGDQFYETNPTTKVRDENPIFDYLYKYYLWLWSYREITRDRPTLVLVDDHDVYHGNLWGNGGRQAPDGNQDLGGYVRAASWVNMVQATQCGHNPDPYDPRPVQQGIGVYYCAFKYGGVEFCLLEDRKFKTAPIQGESLNMHVPELLGDRQEKFVKEWGQKVKDADARICLTATLLGCAQTSPDGLAVVDFDSNGYPPLARIHAVRLLRDANVLILAGDQHLGSVIRLGDDTYTDGPIQFSGPAGSTSWTRWFEPAQPLANAGETPNTGDFQDGFGNKMRVLAVANPSITFKEYRKHIKGRGQGIGDRNLKAEGYGIVDVDLDTREYTLHCWRWDADPAAPEAKQYAGWPMTFGFDQVAKG